MFPQLSYPVLQALISLLLLATVASADSPASFCKCTCFSNSTIIDLGAPSHSPKASPKAIHHALAHGHALLTPRSAEAEPVPRDKKPVRKGGRTCADCNRQFCIDYHLPFCEGAKEEDVFATCFQRDSRKDEAVVFIFIFATAGLLIWAGVRPWIGGWMEAARERQSYIPVGGDGVDHG